MEEIKGKIKRILINNQTIEERDGINYLIGTEQAAKEITLLMLGEKVKALQNLVDHSLFYSDHSAGSLIIRYAKDKISEINKEIDSLKKL